MVPVFLDSAGSVCIELSGTQDDDQVSAWRPHEGSMVFDGPTWDAFDGKIVEISESE